MQLSSNWPDDYDEDLELPENSIMDEFEEQWREDLGNGYEPELSWEEDS